MSISESQDVMKLLVRVLMNNDDFKNGLQDIQSKTTTAAQSISQKFQSVGTTLKNIGSTMTGWGTALTTAITAPVIGLGVYAGKTAVEFLQLKENTKTAFEVLLGSGEKAEKMLQDIYDFAQGSPLSYQSYLEAGKQLVAMGTAANDVIPYLNKMTNAAIATGKGEEGLDTLATAIGRMSTKGKISLEELNRVTEMGIPAVKILGNAYGMTSAQLFEAMKKGEILTEDFSKLSAAERKTMEDSGFVGNALDKLLEGMENGTTGTNGLTAAYGGLAAKMEGTLTGAIDTVKARFRDMTTTLFDSKKAYPVLTNLLYNFSEALKVVPKLLQGFTSAVTPALTNLNNKVKQFTEYVSKADGTKLEKISKIILGLTAAGPVLIILGKMTSGLGGFISLVGKAIPVISTIVTSLGSFGAIMSALPIVGIAAALIILITKFEGFRDAVGKAFTKVGEAGQDLGRVLSPLFNGFMSILETLGTVAIAGVLMAFDGLGKSIKWIADVLSPLTPAFESFGSTMKSFSDTIMGVFNPLVDTTTDFGDTVSEETASAINDYQELESKATTALSGLLYSGSAVTEETKNKIVSAYQEMKDKIVAILEEQKNSTITLVKSAFEDTATITEEKKTETLKAVENYYADQKITVEEGEKQINAIISKAAEEKRVLTEEEQTKITDIQSRMQSIAVEALSKSKDEQLAILEKLKADSGNITAATAAEAVKNSKTQYDGVVQAANDEYDERVKAAAKIKEITPEYSDVADAIIEEAKRQKEEVVTQATEMHDKVVEEAKLQSGDHVNEINWESGEVKTAWQIMLDTAGMKMSELTTGQKTGWDLIKAGITGNNADISKSWETTLNGMVEKGFLTNADLSKMTAEQEKTMLDSWSKTDKNAGEKWANIKKKITDNASTAESNASTSADNLETNASGSFSSTEKAASQEFQALSRQVSAQMNNADKNTSTSVGNMEDSVSNASWSWPKLPTPHFKTHPENWSWNDLITSGTVPSFHIDWYAKGGILNSPTAFGINPYSGSLMVGGEAGPEAIAPIDTLQDYVREAVKENNEKVTDMLETLYDLLSQYFPKLLNRKLVFDTGAVVGALAEPMDNFFGVTNSLKERGSK